MNGRTMGLAVLLWLIPGPAVAGEYKFHVSAHEDGSSRANRRDKTLSLLWGTDGVTAGLHLTPDLVLEGSFADSQLRHEGLPTSHTYRLGLKSFHGNSFYTRWGISHWERNRHVYPDYVGTQSVSSATIGIGNQWQWQYFTLGIRWVELAMPIAKTVRTTSTETEGRSISAAPLPPERPNLNYLGLELGFSF